MCSQKMIDRLLGRTNITLATLGNVCVLFDDREAKSNAGKNRS